MKYRVERSERAERDLDLIFDFLVRSHLEFGESDDRAWEMAGKRMRRIHEALEALGGLPHQGTIRNEILPGIRSATRERAIIYFDVDDAQQLVSIVAVLFGGQDHQRSCCSVFAKTKEGARRRLGKRHHPFTNRSIHAGSAKAARWTAGV